MQKDYACAWKLAGGPEALRSRSRLQRKGAQGSPSSWPLNTGGLAPQHQVYQDPEEGEHAQQDERVADGVGLAGRVLQQAQAALDAVQTDGRGGQGCSWGVCGGRIAVSTTGSRRCELDRCEAVGGLKPGCTRQAVTTRSCAATGLLTCPRVCSLARSLGGQGWSARRRRQQQGRCMRTAGGGRRQTR